MNSKGQNSAVEEALDELFDEGVVRWEVDRVLLEEAVGKWVSSGGFPVRCEVFRGEENGVSLEDIRAAEVAWRGKCPLSASGVIGGDNYNKADLKKRWYSANGEIFPHISALLVGLFAPLRRDGLIVSSSSAKVGSGFGFEVGFGDVTVFSGGWQGECCRFAESVSVSGDAAGEGVGKGWDACELVVYESDFVFAVPLDQGFGVIPDCVPSDGMRCVGYCTSSSRDEDDLFTPDFMVAISRFLGELAWLVSLPAWGGDSQQKQGVM